MAYQRTPNDPFINPPPADDLRRDDLIEPLPSAAEPPASGARVALYGLAVVAVIGALFYGMSSTSNTTAQNEPANNMAVNSSVPKPPVRDVTPQRSNTEPGMTTGAAPSQPAAPTTPFESKTDAN